MNNKLKKPEAERVYYKDLENVGHGMYIDSEYWHNGKPFTGFVVYAYYNNGNIELEQEFQDGQTMGWEVEYHENGKIKYESFMLGATSLMFREYDENGNVTDEGVVVRRNFLVEHARRIGVDPDEIWKYE